MKRFAFVVDDNRMIAKSLMQMLNLLGYEAAVAYGAMMAIQQLAQRVPDVILMDLHMQGLNGIDLCRHLRQDIHLRHVPILAMSSDNQPALIESMREAGATLFLPKPIEMDTLEKALQTIENLAPE
jgi:CheY-like chemotaxis protein